MSKLTRAYWIVCRPPGIDDRRVSLDLHEVAGTYRFDSEQQAINAANDAASRFGGQFVIFKLVGITRSEAVHTPVV